jgi:hypothetical protein
MKSMLVLFTAFMLVMGISMQAYAIPISSLANISAPGGYEVTAPLVATFDDLTPIIPYPNIWAAITISASHVTIDFQGFSLTGPGAFFGNFTIGIFADTTTADVTIKNGTVSEFNQGISLLGADSHVQNVTIENIGPSTPVPEPATMLLLGSGLLSLWGFSRKFRK